MAISLLCPSPRCRRRVTFLDTSAGQSAPCPHRCGARIAVPTPSPTPAWHSPYSAPIAPPVPAKASSSSPGSWVRKVRPLLQTVCVVLPLLKRWGALD
jgi:hypothetical protein